MVSDQDIAEGVETLLRQSEPSSITSLNGVVQQLEAKLGLDLSHKAGFIREQINLLLLRSHPPPPPQQPPPPPPQQQHVSGQIPQKDHFVLQHHPQFPSAHPHHQQQQQQPSPPQQQQHSQHPQGQISQKDHFALQHHPQFGSAQFPSHFALHPFQHDLNFRQAQQAPPPPRGPVQLHHQQHQAVAKTEASPRNANVAAPEMPKESAPAGTKRRGGPGGLNKVCGVTPELQVIVGEPALPRTEIVKQLWAYIRKHNLQDPSNKRKIICDDALRVVFETDCTDMFKMNKLLAKHIIRLEPTKEPSQAKRLKVDAESATESTEPVQSPTQSPVVISEALAKFLGVEGKEMLQSEALTRVWEYIKTNRLEDPLNSMVILCDANLRELLGCESISALGIPEMLARHHLFKQ